MNGRAVAVPFTEIQREKVEWLEPGRIPFGLVTIIAGEPGLGKSMFTTALAAGLSRERETTLMLSAEDSPETTIKPRLEAVNADLDCVRVVHFEFEDGSADGLTLPANAPELGSLVEETRATLVVIDPIVAHLSNAVDAHKDQSVRTALAPLARLANEHNCAVVVVMHLNKSESRDWLRRLSSSIGFAGAARSVLLFARDPDDGDGERGVQRVLAHVKCNVAPLAPSQRWDVQPILLPALENEPAVETARLVLRGETEHDSHDLLALAGDDEEASPREEAVQFLVTELADGPQPATEMKKRATSIGISSRTLDRAKAEARVVSLKEADHWYWRLPEGRQERQGRQESHTGDVAENGKPRHPIPGGDVGVVGDVGALDGVQLPFEERGRP